MSITKQDLKKRLVGCESVGEINAILQAAGIVDVADISEEVAQLVEKVYALTKLGYSLGEAVQYGKSGQFPPEPEPEMEGLIAQQAASGADFKNELSASILQEDVLQHATEYSQLYYPLLAAAINSEAVLKSPEVTQSIETARRIILGSRAGATGKTFLHRAILGAASMNLLPQSPTKTVGLLAAQSDNK